MRALPPICRTIVAGTVVLFSTATARAQSLDELLDDRTFLEGLIEYELDDLLEHVLTTTGRDDAASPFLIRIARARSHAFDTTASRADNAAALARLLDERRSLISTLSNDLRIGGWRLDLSLDLITLTARQRGLDLVVEFGVPGPEQRAQLHAGASEAFENAELASFDLTDAILELEDDPLFAGSAELQARRRELANIEQQRRLPFLLETARYLRAISAPESDSPTSTTDDEMEAVVAGLSSVRGELVEPWQTHATLTLALAEIRMGRFDAASTRLDTVLSRTDLDAASQIRGELAIAMMIGQEQGPRAMLAHLDQLMKRDILPNDPFWNLLLADQRCLARLAVARDFPGAVPGVDQTTPIASAQRLAYRWGLEAYDTFVEDDLLPISRTNRDLIVSERLGRIMPADSAIESWPPGAVMSLAIRRLTEPETRASGITLLRRLATEPKVGAQAVPDNVRARAMTSLGEALIADDASIEGISVLLDMAGAYPTEPTAPTVAARATHLAYDAYLNTGAGDPARSVVVDLFDRALRLMVEQFPTGPGIDRWAYERGRFDLSRNRVDDAITSFSAVGPTARFYVDAQFQIASLQWSQLRRILDHDDETTTDESHEVELNNVRESLGRARLSIAEQLETTLGRQRQGDFEYYMAALDVMLAETDLAARDGESAMRRLDGFDQRIVEPVELLSRAMIARVRAGEMLGRTTQVDDDLMALARRDPARAKPMLANIVDQIYHDSIAERLPPMNITRVRQRDNASGRRYVRLAQLNASLYRNAPTTDGNAIHAQLRFAQGQHGVGEHETARAAYAKINGIEGVTLPLASILGEAECNFVRKNDAEAMRLFRQILGGRSTEGGLNDRVILLAELRCLQLLDRVQQNTDAIYPRIQRLRRLHKDLGGEDLRAAFSTLETRYLP